jgi:hypothetical protein
MIHKALVYIAEKIDEMEVEYPDFVDFKALCLEGLERNVRINCPNDPKCVITTTAGGIPELISMAEALIEELTQECDFGEVTERQALRDTEGDCDGEEEEAL